MPESGFPRKATSRSATTRHLKLASGLAVAALVAGTGAAWAGADLHGAASSVLAAASRNGTGTLGVGTRAEGRPMEVFGPDDFPDEPVTVAKGGTLVVHLAEAAGSTGHSWSMSLTGSSLELTDDDVTEAGENRPGAPGEHTFTFRAKRSGSTTLTFDLARPWEGTPATTLTLTVNVDKASPRPTPLAPVVDVHGPDGLPGRPVEVDAGNILAVHLTEQAGSTGYSWSPAKVPGNLTLVGDTYVAGPSVPGAPGYHIFTFRVKGPGEGTLSFGLARPWEPAPVDRASVTIAVKR